MPNNMRDSILKLFRATMIVGLGICYVRLLTYLMSQYVINFGNLVSALEKTAFTSISALIASVIIVIVNKIFFRLDDLYVGLASAIAAFLYFYVIRADGLTVITHIYLVFKTSYSSFAFLAFLGIPIALGMALNKSRKRTQQSCVPS